jgi:sugar phosphate isomerase/epimerase
MEASQAEYVITPEDANRLVREVDRPNVGTVLDIAHIPWGEDEIGFLQRLERIVHIHLSDADKSRLHLPLGQGTRDLVRVLSALVPYPGSVALEGFSISAGGDLARWNKAQFEELWREAVSRRREPLGPAPYDHGIVYSGSS